MTPLENHLDFLANLGEIVEAFAGQVSELTPLRYSIFVGPAREVLEHQDERSAGADVAAAGEEVASHQRLEHARLTAALAAHHGHLRQRNLGQLAPHRRQNVLELVDDRDHRRPDRRRRRRSSWIGTKKVIRCSRFFTHWS